MPGLRILNVHPRLIGPLGEVARWRELFELAAAGGFNMVWWNPLHRTTEVVFEEHGKERRRSLYAIADHDAFDVALSGGDAERDRAALAEAIAYGRRLGVHVMIDLVLNHVAVDHPLVLEEDERVRGGAVRSPDELLFVRNADGMATDFDGGTGFDNAQLAFSSAAARRFFLGESEASAGAADAGTASGAGAPGRWKRLLESYLELGVRGFRCDMAYSVPASWWRELVGHARSWARRHAGEEVVFLAETLGGKEKNLQLGEARLDDGRLAFELSMLSTAWWDLEADWLGDEMMAAQRIAYHGGAGSPDNHDLPETLAERLLRELRAARPPASADDELEMQRVVAALCERNYAAAALVGSSVYATASYLFCLEQSSVFWEPERMARLARAWRERAAPEHPLNLCRRVATINDFLNRLPLRRARLSLAAPPRTWDGGRISAFAVLLHDLENGGELGWLVVAVERSYERGAAGGDGAGGDAAWVEALAAAAGGAGQGGLTRAVRELEAELMGQASSPRSSLRSSPSTSSGSGSAPEGEPLWLATPLLRACFRAAPAEP